MLGNRPAQRAGLSPVVPEYSFGVGPLVVTGVTSVPFA